MTDIKRFEEFADDVREAMALRYPDDKVELKRVTKNNGVIYTGISVRNEDEKVYPTLYLEPFFEECGEAPLDDETVDRICSIYESRRIGSVPELDFLSDYECVRKNLRCKLINYKSNEEFLKDVPCRKFMDLAIVPYYRIKDCDLGKSIMSEGSFVIRKTHLDMWEVSAESLISESIRNTFTMENPVITGIYEVLKKMNPAFAESVPKEAQAAPMYVMTTDGAGGAVSMLYEDKIGEFCDSIDSDVYIVPSSVNEVILVPEKGCIPENMLNEMVREVNATELQPVDVLSDHVYYFDRYEGYRMAV